MKKTHLEMKKNCLIQQIFYQQKEVRFLEKNGGKKYDIKKLKKSILKAQTMLIEINKQTTKDK